MTDNLESKFKALTEVALRFLNQIDGEWGLGDMTREQLEVELDAEIAAELKKQAEDEND